MVTLVDRSRGSRVRVKADKANQSVSNNKAAHEDGSL